MPIRGSDRTLLTARHGSETRLLLEMPTLTPGLHCLIVAVTQAPEEAWEVRAEPVAIFVGWRLQAGSGDGAGAERCVASRPARGIESPASVGCSGGFIAASEHKLLWSRRVDPSASLWAYSPVCEQPAAVMLLRNGEWQLHGDLAPIDLRGLEQDLLVPLPGLMPADYAAIMVRLHREEFDLLSSRFTVVRSPSN